MRTFRRLPALLAAGLLVVFTAACDEFLGAPPSRPNVSSVSGYVSIGGAGGSAHKQILPLRQASVNTEIVPGRVIVKLKETRGLSAMSAATSLSVGSLFPDSALPGITQNTFELTFAGVGEADTLRLAAELSDREDVVTAEVVPIISALAYPDDPLYPNQWGLTHIGASAAWLLAGADLGSVPAHTIAVIDSGTRPHPDIDYLPGLNLVEGGTDTTDYSTSLTSHGTHVAGIAGARVNNGYGVAGVSPNARILPVKVLRSDGNGGLDDFADAIAWAAGVPVPGLPDNPNPAKVINISAGGETFCHFYLQEAIDLANARGATVVVAAGNEASDAILTTPANCAGVVTVGATGPAQGVAAYSNTGTNVDIMAPGGDFNLALGSGGGILSTDWEYTTRQPTYRALQGTSMATPHVSGALAFLRARYPSLTATQATDLLRNTARPLSSADCRGYPSEYCGAGLMDLEAAVVAGPPHNPDAGSLIVVAAHCFTSNCASISTSLSKVHRYASTATGAPYAFTELANGRYYLWAYVDLNGDGRWEAGEPWGEYPRVLDLNGRAARSIDIVIDGASPLSAQDAGLSEHTRHHRTTFQVP